MSETNKQIFAEYCLDNNIIPLKNKTIFLPRHSNFTTSFKDTINSDSKGAVWFDYESYAEYCTDGQKKLLKELRNGKYQIIAALDLHNNTQESALLKLQNFLNSFVTTGATCLKIIHGKGLNSPNNKAILKHMVRRYLEHFPRTLAYSYANINNGGDGATLAKLKS